MPPSRTSRAGRAGLPGLAAAVILASFLVGCTAMGGTIRGERLALVRASPNHGGTVFVNDEPTPNGIQGSPVELLGWLVFGDEVRRPKEPLPVDRVDPARFSTPPGSGLRITWLGHSSVLVEIDGARVLTDPIWSQRASPSCAVGPERFQPVPIALGDLPPLDAVVISHDHYDHLDHATIVALAGTGVPFIVPLGVGAHLEHWQVPREQIVELDWWQRVTTRSGITLVATPARHFSGRSLTDRNRTLWASWVIKGPRHRVYFGGDTGLFSGFSVIGDREGPFDATLMPIGSYSKAWKAIHLTPEEAINAHMMVRGGLFVPIHWGTFNLAFHDWFEPVERLFEVGQAAEIDLVIPRAGQLVEPANPPALEAWWRPLR